ncbi:hypothetical protein GQR58_020292 [Nymphon striatum]|nr:hypothetical protein GQR58_020292 [Nymphon striatum]
MLVFRNSTSRVLNHHNWWFETPKVDAAELQPLLPKVRATCPRTIIIIKEVDWVLKLAYHAYHTLASPIQFIFSYIIGTKLVEINRILSENMISGNSLGAVVKETKLVRGGDGGGGGGGGCMKLKNLLELCMISLLIPGEINGFVQRSLPHLYTLRVYKRVGEI